MEPDKYNETVKTKNEDRKKHTHTHASERNSCKCASPRGRRFAIFVIPEGIHARVGSAALLSHTLMYTCIYIVSSFRYTCCFCTPSAHLIATVQNFITHSRLDINAKVTFLRRLSLSGSPRYARPRGNVKISLPLRRRYKSEPA